MWAFVIKRFVQCLGGLAALGFAIVAAACGPLQQAGQPPVTTTTPAASMASIRASEVDSVESPTAGPATPVVTTPAAAGTPQRVALLLPLSGAQRSLAEAVRDGFIAAYLEDGATGMRPEISIFDEEQGGAAQAYRSAVASGADVVVGPLLKESVGQVAAAVATTRTLALNYLDSATAAPPGFYQFALSPEDEAREAAFRAIADGRQAALALVPNNEWGRRMLTAFEAALGERSARLLAYQLYDPGGTDFTADIDRLLQLDQGRARHRQLTANLGVSLEFEPRRRSDADFIFVAANVAAGRLIRPQLRFLYAADLPTYSSSAIYQPGSTGDVELDGVMFTDAPVLLGTDERAARLRTALASRWGPGSVARARFFAMGFDAYNLLRALSLGSPGTLPGVSGSLSMDAQGRVHRQMPWAEFREGRIVVLPESLPPDPSSASQPL